MQFTSPGIAWMWQFNHLTLVLNSYFLLLILFLFLLWSSESNWNSIFFLMLLIFPMSMSNTRLWQWIHLLHLKVLIGVRFLNYKSTSFTMKDVAFFVLPHVMSLLGFLIWWLYNKVNSYSFWGGLCCFNNNDYPQYLCVSRFALFVFTWDYILFSWRVGGVQNRILFKWKICS